ncbi:MAG: archease [Desulfosarcinaceae bacterium]|nr:archease [Desulfosarcinaceae bacterium]
MPYQFIDHTADLGLQIVAPDLPELYETAAAALGHQLLEAAPNQEIQCQRLKISGEDRADLLINWLRELLAFWHVEGRAVRAARCLALSPHTLTADVDLLDFDPAVHTPKQEIKAVTYHQLDVSSCAEGWRATVIFDL